MHLFLIRHGETEHNVAGLLAGVTDSRLTNHGVLQTQRLGNGLVRERGVRLTNVYSSDLQRAILTADEICKAQNKVDEATHKVEVVKLELLREQDFGSLELVPWSSKQDQQPFGSKIPSPDDPSYKPKETAQAVRERADAFLDNYIEPLFAIDVELGNVIAVVSHGLFLAQLWRALLARFDTKAITLNSDMPSDFSARPWEHMAWSNTGYLELQIRAVLTDHRLLSDITPSAPTVNQTSSPFTGATMAIRSINDKRHLLGLKRSRGGIGSAAHDQRQQNLNSFFKKRTSSIANEEETVIDGKDNVVAKPREKKARQS